MYIVYILGLCIWAKQQANDNSWTSDTEKYIQLVEERSLTNPALLEIAPIMLMTREIGMEGVSMSLAYAAISQNKYGEAIENFSNALSINPNNSYALLNRGIAQLVNRNLMSGVQHFTTAITVDVRFADPFYFRGIAYSLIGDQVKAKNDFTQFVKLGGDRSLITDEKIREMTKQFKN